MAEYAVSKYVPVARRKVEITLNDADIVPREVPIEGLRASVPEEIRQFPRRGDGALPPFQNEGVASTTYRVSGASDPPPRGAGCEGTGAYLLPKSYESRDWQSVNKVAYPAREVERVNPELQRERGVTMRWSTVPLPFGQRNPTNLPFGPRGTQMEESTRMHHPDHYSSRGPSFGIGSVSTKTQSDVTIASVPRKMPLEHYESMTRRQFEVHGSGHSGKKCSENQLDNNRSHFNLSFGGNAEMRSVMKQPLPSVAPKIKNKPPPVVDGAAALKAKSPSHARPVQMSPKDVSTAKLKSAVPLMGNLGDVGLSESAAGAGDDPGHMIGSKMTSAASELPLYNARTERARDPTAFRSAGLKMGEDGDHWVTSHKSHFRGVWQK